MIQLAPVNDLHAAVLSAFWRWTMVMKARGRDVQWSELEPIKQAFDIIRDGDAPEKAAVIAGTTPQSLEVWELALHLQRGQCPAEFAHRSELGGADRSNKKPTPTPV